MRGIAYLPPFGCLLNTHRMRKIEEEHLSIVLRGNFNPTIFQPYWFYVNGLLGEGETKAAKIEVIHEHVLEFSLDWLNIQVLHDRFTVRLLQSGYEEALRDLVLGTFKLLNHTPSRVMGVNKGVHFMVQSVDEWHSIGHKLAPKEGIWDGVLSKPGTFRLVIEGQRSDGFKGYVRVRVEPSQKHHPGVFVRVNDHFVGKGGEKVPAIPPMMEILSSQWENCVERSKKIIRRVMDI